MQRLARLIAPRFHYSWIALAVVFLILLCAAGTRATPSVMMLPLEHEFGWSRSTISLAISIGIALYGLTGPFAAASMQYFGIRPTVLGALIVLVSGTALSAMMHEPWQMVLLWGVMVGGGTGVAAITLGATVVNRWFSSRRGLMMGLLTASTATGTLLFLPGLAALASSGDWRRAVWAVTAATAALVPLAWWLVRDRPASVGLTPYGSAPDTPLVAPAPRTGC